MGIYNVRGIRYNRGMTKKEKDRLLEMYYNTDQLDKYVALLTEDMTEYDWSMFHQAMNTPNYNEFTGEIDPSYNEQYPTK